MILDKEQEIKWAKIYTKMFFKNYQRMKNDIDTDSGSGSGSERKKNRINSGGVRFSSQYMKKLEEYTRTMKGLGCK